MCVGVCVSVSVNHFGISRYIWSVYIIEKSYVSLERSR